MLVKCQELWQHLRPLSDPWRPSETLPLTIFPKSGGTKIAGNKKILLIHNVLGSDELINEQLVIALEGLLAA